MTAQPTRSDARENRRRILLAAREVFAAQGLGAEVKVIADHAGVGVGTIYRNFGTKEGLVLAMLNDLVDQFREALDLVETQEDVAGALVQLCAAGWQIAEQSGELFVALLKGGIDPKTVAHDLVRRVTTILERGVAAGILRRDVTPGFMAEYVSATIPAVYLRLRMRYGREEAAENCTRLLLGALFADTARVEPAIERWRCYLMY